VKTFRVRFIVGAEAEIQADFVTAEIMMGNGNVFFWRKPHWYSRRRCVAVLDWAAALAVLALDPESDAKLAKALGVQL